jgi:hypothetical protein
VPRRGAAVDGEQHVPGEHDEGFVMGVVDVRGRSSEPWGAGELLHGAGGPGPVCRFADGPAPSVRGGLEGTEGFAGLSYTGPVGGVGLGAISDVLLDRGRSRALDRACGVVEQGLLLFGAHQAE